MKKKIEWRYAKGTPVSSDSFVYLGDSAIRLADACQKAKKLSLPPVRLLLTSPPYCGITNYNYDQWLRLWLLGGPPNALARPGPYKAKFGHQKKYRELLLTVFTAARSFLHRKAVIYVRTDHREVTLKMTTEVLHEVFPKKRMRRYERHVEKPTQTHLFRNEIEKSAEVDIVLLPRS
jgi:hypothetical protein